MHSFVIFPDKMSGMIGTWQVSIWYLLLPMLPVLLLLIMTCLKICLKEKSGLSLTQWFTTKVKMKDFSISKSLLVGCWLVC